MNAMPTATELARRIRVRETSAREVADAALERIARLNGELHAFLTVDEDGVRAAAAAADRALAQDRRTSGPLHGVPIAVKDLEDTAGLRTTYGSTVYRDHVPRADSILVQRLRRAGAVVLGKTNTPAFGLLGETKNRLGDDCRNPWDPRRTTGGSSGGSAVAVATGMAPLATGTDSAGSITAPAGMCGVVGIKPTHGRVPMWPNYGDSLTFNDGGPLAATVEDAALLLSVLAGHDPRDPVSRREAPPGFVAAVGADTSTLRIAFSADLGHFAVDPEVVEVTRRHVRSIAGDVAEIDDATPEIDDPWSAYTPIYQSDLRAALDEHFRDHPDDLFAETLREVEGTERITGAQVAAAFGGLARFRGQMQAFFERHDVLLTPATAVPAFAVGQPPERIGDRAVEPGWRTFMPFSIPWNMTGQPAAAIPAGLSRDGLPIGLLVVGRLGREDDVIAVASAFERRAPWVDRRPLAEGGVTVR